MLDSPCVCGGHKPCVSWQKNCTVSGMCMLNSAGVDISIDERGLNVGRGIGQMGTQPESKGSLLPMGASNAKKSGDAMRCSCKKGVRGKVLWSV